MKILFAGTPEIAVPSLRLLADNFDVVLVLTNPDRPQGRKRRESDSPVKEAALDLGFPVIQPERLDAYARKKISGFSPELLVTFAYGRIFGPKFLSLFPRGAVNVHPSLLPKFRGCAPIPAAILAGEKETGITIQKIALEMDSGDILSQLPCALDGSETTGSLTRWASGAGAELLVDTLRAVVSGTAQSVPQEHDAATYCSMIRKQDGVIDWQKSAGEIGRMVRAYTPWPGARTTYGGTGLLVHGAEPTRERQDAPPGKVTGMDREKGILVQTGSTLLALKLLQRETKKVLPWEEFLRGNQKFIGTILGGI